MPEMMIPRKTHDGKLRERITRSLDAAIEEADRVGYVSAEQGKRQVDELLKRLGERAAAGEIKP